MPLFRRGGAGGAAPPDREARQRAEAEQAASREALERGGLPLKAQQRLAALGSSGGGGFSFTSDLSVNEFALGAAIGLRPLSQVMGSSVYHVGWQQMPGSWGSGWGAGWQPDGISQELGVLSDAWNTARRLAFGRLEQEARLVGAHAVVGVHLTRRQHEWASGSIEYIAVGTAVRIEGAPPAEQPALTDLSGQDFWKLWQAGYAPLGVVGASTVFYVMPSWSTQWAQSGGIFGSGWNNQELGDFTQALYEAREVALGRVTAEARALGAAGVVGVSIDQSEREREVEQNNRKRTDLIITFHVLGTAIGAQRDHAADLTVTPTLALRAGRKERLAAGLPQELAQQLANLPPNVAALLRQESNNE
ncbi:MAG TPA: heavy metal-binding domain-containing protein [Actinomycetota bacterium]